MDFRLFLDELLTHWNSGLPLVAYRIPSESTVKALLQDSDKLHISKDFDESGFVIAPFDSSKDAFIFPVEQCKQIQVEFLSAGVSLTENEMTITHTENSKRFHMSLVEKGIKAINSGELKKIVLSREEKVPISETWVDIFQRLLETYPSAFVYFWYHPKIGIWLGATPETLLKIENNRFSTMALAGTQVYKGTLDVLWGVKEREEQDIVTKSIVRSLKKNISTIEFSDAYTAKAGNLLHLRTDIRGTLIDKLEKVNLKLLISSIHPTPAVCGFPKEKAKEFILENENYNREFYTGFLGELNFYETKSRNSNKRNIENKAFASVKKVSNLYVNLRCMKLDYELATLYVGGGITKDSIPEDEWNETVNKTQTIKHVL